MAQKILFQTALTDLETTDVEGLGKLRYEPDGRVYRWVKNAGATALVASGCCLMKIVSTSGDMVKRVLPADGAPSTNPCSIDLAAGVPISAIGASGASTGDHGWILVRGIDKAYYAQSSAGTNQTYGCWCVGTSSLPATQPWGQAYNSYVDSVSVHYVHTKKILLAQDKTATTGPATAVLSVVDVQCL